MYGCPRPIRRRFLALRSLGGLTRARERSIGELRLFPKILEIEHGILQIDPGKDRQRVAGARIRAERSEFDGTRHVAGICEGALTAHRPKCTGHGQNVQLVLRRPGRLTGCPSPVRLRGYKGKPGTWGAPRPCPVKIRPWPRASSGRLALATPGVDQSSPTSVVADAVLFPATGSPSTAPTSTSLVKVPARSEARTITQTVTASPTSSSSRSQVT